MDPDDSIRKVYERRKQEFACRALELGHRKALEYIWYHTIDLGNGLVTPGVYDYRETVSAFQFPPDMHGMRVLDIGSATGFFAFEFERRGAAVTSVDLPSLKQLDRFPGQSTDDLILKIQRMQFPRKAGGPCNKSYSATEMYHLLLDGPFRFCKRVLRSNGRRRYSSIYDLSLRKLGTKQPFDLVFLGDVLIHTIAPLQALAAIAPLCGRTLVLSQVMDDDDAAEPAMIYTGGATPDDEISWWQPNKNCFVQILKKLGFTEITQVGKNCGYLQHEAYWFERPILHAVK
ncbi:MAG: class I SAM-dependent methyltransferase [Bryobacteraceae bacterium]